MNKEVVIIGAGGHGRVIADIIEKSGDSVFGFLDDDTSKSAVIGTVDDCRKYSDKYFIIAIGNNSIRQNIAERYNDLNYYTAIHPSAVLAPDVKIGEGTAVMANAVINSLAKIGQHCIINTSSVIEHDDILENFVHVSPNAVLCGTVTVGEKTHIGAGAAVRNNLSICGGVTIGVGAAVVKDITKPGVYIGTPAKFE